MEWQQYHELRSEDMDKRLENGKPKQRVGGPLQDRAAFEAWKAKARVAEKKKKGEL